MRQNNLNKTKKSNAYSSYSYLWIPVPHSVEKFVRKFQLVQGHKLAKYVASYPTWGLFLESPSKCFLTEVNFC